jgi:hypothetical protein
MTSFAVADVLQGSKNDESSLVGRMQMRDI